MEGGITVQSVPVAYTLSFKRTRQLPLPTPRCEHGTCLVCLFCTDIAAQLMAIYTPITAAPPAAAAGAANGDRAPQGNTVPPATPPVLTPVDAADGGPWAVVGAPTVQAAGPPAGAASLAPPASQPEAAAKALPNCKPASVAFSSLPAEAIAGSMACKLPPPPACTPIVDYPSSMEGTDTPPLPGDTPSGAGARSCCTHHSDSLSAQKRQHSDESEAVDEMPAKKRRLVESYAVVPGPEAFAPSGVAA